MTMKTCNYLTKLPQEATIKKVETFRYYDLITLDLPVPKQRLCPHCGSSDCIIKDSGACQTVRHIPYGHRGSAITFHKRRLFCKDCCTSFYETPYWVHPSLHITQALYDSILLDLLEPISFTEAARRSCVSPDTVQSVFESIRFGLPKKLPETICIDEFKGNSGIWNSKSRRWYLNKYHCSISALRLFLVFLLFSPVFLISSPVYLEELLSFLVSPQSFSLSWCPPDFSQLFSFFWCS